MHDQGTPNFKARWRSRDTLFASCSAAAMIVAMASTPASATELLVHGGFESGTLIGWTSTDSNGPTDGCDTRWTVGGSSATTGCSVNDRNPANPIGAFAAYSSFDGNGPQTFSLRQGIAISGSMSNATLSWSDSFGALYSGAPRTMTINIVGATTQTVYTYTLPYDLPSATGWTSHSLDITAALNNFVGQNVALEFLLTIPENFTGAAGAGLDNVSLDVTSGPFDGTAPGLTIDGPAGVQTAPFLVNFNFSEDVGGFDVSDVALTNATISGFSGSGSSYNATITPQADGLVSLDVGAGAYEDAFGNDNTAPSSFSVQADVTVPTVIVGSPAVAVNAPFVATFDFSEAAADFTLDDIGVVNGVASALSGSGSSYSATITPNTDGAVDVSLAAGVVTDTAGNANQASNTLSVVADLTAPVITTPGTINVGTDPGLDTATVPYSVTADDPGNGALTPTLVSGPASGSAFPVGATTISYSATDAAGNVANASFDIIVGDDENPVIVDLPADISVNTDFGQPTAIVNWPTPSVTDNAAGASLAQTAGPASGSAFPIGTTLVTYEAQDASGNIVSASFNVTVADIEGPSIVGLPADISVSTDAGQPTASVTWTPPSVGDNAPGATITQTTGPAPGSSFPVGVTIITYEAGDAAGNITSDSFTISVTDNEGPSIVGLPADITVSTDAGQATAVVSWTAPTASDNAPGATITQTSGPTPGSALPIGVTTISYEAEDASGNTASASFTISVADDEAPAIVGLPSDISVDTDAGQSTALVSWTPPTVSDNAPGAAITQTAGPAPGSAFPVGATTITYEAHDAAGQTATASFIVTVADNEGPVIAGLSANLSVGTDPGQDTAVVNWSAPSVSDNAPGATITQTSGPAPGSALPIGVTTISYEAQDASGNTASASFSITVADDEAPAIVSLPADINVSTDPGQATALVSWTSPSVSDNAPGATIAQTAGPAPGSAFPVGTTTITYASEDASGNVTTASFNVSVSDNEGPAIAGLPADISVGTDPGQATAVVTWAAPSVSDNAAGATITQTSGPAPGSALPIGATTISYEAQDAAGNTASASFTIVVTDDEGPAIAGLPSAISVNTDAGQPTAVVNWTAPSVTDNAPGATIAQTSGPAPGSAFAVGTTTISYTAQDAVGNIATASFSVVVQDGEPPAIVGLPADIAQTTDAGLSTAIVNWTPPTVNDNAAGATITQTEGPAPGSAFPIGATTVTYQAQDTAGNMVAASFAVTIEDGEPPAIVGLPSDMAVNTDPGQPTAAVTWTPPTLSDNAPGATIIQTEGPAPGSDFPVGATTISFKAEDAAGSSVTASFEITVQDAEAPVIVGLPLDIAQPTDAGLATAVVNWTEPTVSDNAPGAAITRTAGPVPGSPFPIGATTITYEAQDASGNIVAASFNVTIEDNEAPAIVGLPTDIAANTDAGLSTAIVTWTPPTASDNAPGATITQTAGLAPGSAFPIGATTITYEAQDAAGATTVASFTIDVADNELPAIAGMPADINVNTDAGLPTAVVSWTPPTVNDNAPGATLSQTAGPAPGSAFPIGATTITYQAQDIAGNNVSQSFSVTVQDAEPPVLVGLPADIVLVVDYPDTSAVATWTPPTISDNTPGASVTQIAGPAPGSSFPLGPTTITYRAEDGSGNTVDQSFTVTVSQTAPGSVRLVVQSGEDGSFAFASPEPDLNLTIDTVSGDGEATVMIRPGVFDLSFALPAGFGILSAECNDSNSDLNESSQTGTINVASNEQVTCAIVTVDSVTETSRLIGAFMGARANLIVQNMPDADRRIDRLNGTTSAPAGVSAFGMTIGRGDAPFDLSLGEDRSSFAFSLAGLRAQRAENQRQSRDEQARWGDGQFERDWTLSRGNGFAGFGETGLSADPAALATSFGAGETRAPNGRRSGEGAYPGAAAGASESLPDAGPQHVDVWVEGTYAQFETNVGDGDFYMLSAGFDYLKNEDVLIGFGAQFDWTDMSGPVAGSSISGQGYLVGPYMTARLSEGLYFDGHVAIGRSSNEVSPFGLYEDEVNAERTYLSAALIGDIKKGAWTVRPEGRVTFFREEMDSYVDGIGVTIPSMEVSTGELEFSPTVRYRYDLEDDATFTPFASIEGIWTFEHEDTAAFALGSDAFIDNGVRGRIQAGFDFVRPGGMQISGLGFYDGIGEDDFASWGAQVRVSLSFEPH